MADKQMLTPNGSPCIRIVPANDANSPNHQHQHHNNLRNGDVKPGNGLLVQTIGNQQKQSFKCDGNGEIGGDKRSMGSMEPPDGGARAWCVMVAAFLCNSIIFGIINVYGPIFTKLFENLKANGDLEASSKACKLFDEFFKCENCELLRANIEYCVRCLSD